MIFDIHISLHKSAHWEIDVEDKEAAEKVAKEKLGSFVSDININPSIYVTASDKNYRLQNGAVYLVSHYSKFFPAVASYSRRTFGRNKYIHTLRWVHNNRGFELRGENPKRIIKRLCNDGKIDQEKCKDCVGKFTCFTHKR